MHLHLFFRVTKFVDDHRNDLLAEVGRLSNLDHLRDKVHRVFPEVLKISMEEILANDGGEKAA